MESNALLSLQVIKEEVTQMDENTDLTDKNIKIETGTGNAVNVTCSYTEGTTLEALFFILSGAGKCSKNGSIIAGVR